MMRTRLTLGLIISMAIAALLAACQTPTPAPPTIPPSLAPVETLAAGQLLEATVPPTPIATEPEPHDYPLRPTATPYKGSSSVQSGVFRDDAAGISVAYPRRWSVDTSEANGQLLARFISPLGDVQGILIAGAVDDTQSAQAVAYEVRNGLTGSLSGVKTLDDKALTLADGREAWRVVFTAKRSDGSELKADVTATSNGARAYIMVVFGEPAAFDDNASSIDQLIGALHIERPRLNGIERDQALVLAGGETRNPREYDPATTHGSGDKLVYSGLVAFDPQLNLIPDLAGSWDIQSGITYTFHLRPDARFHNGRPVTAQDVIYSWERAADPATGSDTVLTYLGDIVGVKDRQAGKADRISGLTALDDHTLQVVIDAPKPYFLMKLTYPVAFVLDRNNVAAGGEWWRTPNGTGPYRLARWDSFKQMVYERNDDYYLEPPKIPYVIVQLFSGVGLRLYENGEIDVTGVSRADVPRFEDPKEPLSAELQSGVSLCTGMIIFDSKQPPFDDVKVRQAFTLAFDRSKFIDIVLSGIALPAIGPYPPGLPGYNAELKGLPYDPARARELLAESKYAGHLPPIVYTDSGNGSDIGADVSALAQMWQQNLGITLTVENIDPDKYFDLMHAGQHGQIFSGGWCADYPDPENFADALFHTGAQQNQGNYSNPALDKILEDARVEQDPARRIQLYQRAEQIIVDDAPVLFTTHGLSYLLVKPYVIGYTLTPIDIALERYLSIDPTKMK